MTITSTPSAVRRVTEIEGRYLASLVTVKVPEAEKVRDGIAVVVSRLNRAPWKSVDYSGLSQVQRALALGVPCKIHGMIASMTEVIPVHFEGSLLDTMTFSIEDEYSDQITSSIVVDENIAASVRSAFHAQRNVDVVGCPVLLPVYSKAGKFERMAYRFLAVDVVDSSDPLQIVAATSDEILDAEKLVTKLAKKRNGIFSFIHGELIDIIGIQGLDKSPLLDRSLSAMILQSLSDGYDSSRSLSHKIHTLVVGSPAVGKKLLVEAAGILNPASTEGHPSKLSIAGVVGRAHLQRGVWRSEPGLIPMAHGGTFAIQDYHHVPVQMKNELMGVLSLCMEDGRLRDGTAAKKTHNALTAIHIDMNKHSDVYIEDSEDVAGGQSRLEDLGLSMNVLTRFDFAVEIPRDVTRQLAIALDMHTGSHKTSRYPTAIIPDDRQRRLKVLVAFLRSRFAEIEIPVTLAEGKIRPKQAELLKANKEQLTRLKLLGDFQTRMSNSVHKFAFAIARSNARSIATAEDVDQAFEFIAAKMDFLSTIEPFETPASWKAAATANKVESRRKFIIEKFAAVDVTPEKILDDVRKQFGSTVSLTTVRRDLNAVSDKPKHGTFRVRLMQTEESQK